MTTQSSWLVNQQQMLSPTLLLTIAHESYTCYPLPYNVTSCTNNNLRIFPRLYLVRVSILSVNAHRYNTYFFSNAELPSINTTQDTSA